MATLGCIQAKMGQTPYYICKMAAEEKMQRECDIKRIVEEIVPYVTDDPDRFFSSLIVDIYSGFDEICFEPLSTVAGSLPAAYAVPMADMGFITLPGKERLIALDGQHRLLSLKIAIRGIMGVPGGTKISAALNDLNPPRACE